MIIKHKNIITEVEGRQPQKLKGVAKEFDFQLPPISIADPNDPLNVFRRKFTVEEINYLPSCQYGGEIVLVKDKQDLPGAIKFLTREAALGFDTESRPVFSKGKKNNPPSLLQLAAAEKVFIFQLGDIGFGPELCTLLENSAIIKTGVAVRDDIRELQRLYLFEPAGFVDLSQVAKQNRIPTHGLRNMAANFFGVRIPKGARCSNWAAKNLSQKQLLYAATDAWIGRELYFEMRKQRLEF